MLQKQKRIDELKNEVERVVGRLRFLNDRVKYSTLNIEIYKHIKHEKAQVEEDGFFTRLWEGLTKGWDRFLNFIIGLDRKSTRLNSSHVRISYAVFCLK